MKDKLVEFKTAVLAKEKGVCKYFENINGTKYVPAFYSEDGINFEETEFQQEDCTIDGRYFRPTQSLLQRWLREVHNINVYCMPNIIDENKWFNNIASHNPVFLGKYEKVLEIGLFEALKLIKNK